MLKEIIRCLHTSKSSHFVNMMGKTVDKMHLKIIIFKIFRNFLRTVSEIKWLL